MQHLNLPSFAHSAFDISTCWLHYWLPYSRGPRWCLDTNIRHVDQNMKLHNWVLLQKTCSHSSVLSYSFTSAHQHPKGAIETPQAVGAPIFKASIFGCQTLPGETPSPCSTLTSKRTALWDMLPPGHHRDIPLGRSSCHFNGLLERVVQRKLTSNTFAIEVYSIWMINMTVWIIEGMGPQVEKMGTRL